MKPTPITRGSIYRLLSGALVRATIDRGGVFFGRLVTPAGEGEPTTPIPPDAPLVEAYVPRSTVATGEVADHVAETRR